jgi:predicted SAM-dependent methyltransferase
MIPESVKYRLLVGSPTINWLNRILRPSNWLAKFRTKIAIKNAVIRGGPLKLFIGCGRIRLDDSWLHGDIHRSPIYINALKALPFADNQLDFIFSEHFIEHVPEVKLRKFWKESYRVLKPGGWMRHTTPDLKFMINLYLGKVDGVTLEIFYDRIRHIRKDTPHSCIFMNEILTLWGHLFNYDEDYIKIIWQESGFVNVRRCKFRESVIPQLNNLEQHGNEEWVQQQFTLIMEAQKPE